MRRIIAMAVSLVWISGCSPWNAANLNSLQGYAAIEEERDKLGPPNRVQRGNDGAEQWMFEVCDGTTAKGAARYNCEGYILTFDRQKVLQEWTRTP